MRKFVTRTRRPAATQKETDHAEQTQDQRQPAQRERENVLFLRGQRQEVPQGQPERRRQLIDFGKITRPSFGRPTRGPAGTPAPLRGRALRRRQAMFKEAGELLPHLPTAPGEAVHCLMTGRTDLCVQLAAILEFYGKTCPVLRVATLSFNTRNVSELSELLRSGRVGTLTLLCSEFF